MAIFGRILLLLVLAVFCYYIWLILFIRRVLHIDISELVEQAQGGKDQLTDFLLRKEREQNVLVKWRLLQYVRRKRDAIESQELKDMHAKVEKFVKQDGALWVVLRYRERTFGLLPPFITRKTIAGHLSIVGAREVTHPVKQIDTVVIGEIPADIADDFYNLEVISRLIMRGVTDRKSGEAMR